MENLNFKITVEYICNDMIDAETLEKDFDNDLLKFYENLTDGYTEPVTSFAVDNGKIIKIEVID